VSDERPEDIDAFLSAHPWPEELRHCARPLDYRWRFDLDVSAATLWRHLEDTSRLNRALGLGSMTLEERDGVLHGAAIQGGLAHRWVEGAWSWVHERRIWAERAYGRGFARHARVCYELAPEGDRVRFYAYFGWLPRNPIYRLVLRFGAWLVRNRLAALLAALAPAARDDGGLATPFVAPPEPLPAPARERLDAAGAALRGRRVDEAALAQLMALIERGDDIDVYRLQPRKLARDWRRPERDVLHLCLHATRVGLLELSWDVICPHCRGARQELRALGEVEKTARCEACRIEFGTEGDHAIEVTFHIHPAIRKVHKQLFCSAQTSSRRHIQVQQLLEPGEERLVITALGPGRYRLRLLGSMDVSYLDVAPEHAAAAVRWRAALLPASAARAAPPELLLVNDTAAAATFIVEDVNWADEALRPAHLFSFQGFRDLFSEEYIGADVQLAIGEQTLLFTDIVGSTRLYCARGDPEAFMLVRKHFDELFRIVDGHEGAVVKTIGDATMACFRSAAQALAAARAMHQAFPPEGPGIALRVSIHTGVCIAVNLNSLIDYFGSTVNIAAKLQSAAGAGDIVLSEVTRAAPGVAALLEHQGAALTPVAVAVAGFDAPVAAHRWATARAEAQRRE
jgi:class 3 adenylate cyclase